ncbi:iron-containing alcohol dehydrogenase [Chloroflexota bacterium]
MNTNIMNIKIPDTIIGLGSVSQIGELVKSFALTRAHIITDKGIAKAGIIDTIKSPLDKAGLKVDITDDCEAEPGFSYLEKLSERVKAGKYDLLIGLGGGSVMDATKVISLLAANADMNLHDLAGGKTPEKVLTKILIPTTAGTGSEWSASAVLHDDKADNKSVVIRTHQNMADAVIIDPELTTNLPPRVTADTGMDALSHAIEGYISPGAGALSDMFASTAIELVSDNLRLAYKGGKENLEARYNMCIAAAVSLRSGQLCGAPGLLHPMSELLGAKARITHGTTLTLLLPHIMEYTLVAYPEKFARIAELMGENIKGLPVLDAAAKSVDAVRKLARDLYMPQKLSEASSIKITEADVIAWGEDFYMKFGPIMSKMSHRHAGPEDITRLFTAVL